MSILFVALVFGLMGALSVASLVIIISRVLGGSRHKQVTRLLAEYGAIRGAGETADLEAIGSSGTANTLVNRFRRMIANNLIAAGVKYTIDNYIAFSMLVGAGAGFAAFIATSALLVSSLAGLVAAVVIPHIYLKALGHRRSLKFAEELPTLLQVLASSLRAGLSFAQALETAAQQDRGEVGTQMRQALAEVKLGADLEEALLRVSDRMKSLDLKWLVSALEIQREVGGSLSGILETVAETIRGREEVRREVQVLSAEGKLSAYVLLAMPFVTLLMLAAVRPGYINFFFDNEVGLIMTAIFAALITVGWIWMKRVVKVDV